MRIGLLVLVRLFLLSFSALSLSTLLFSAAWAEEAPSTPALHEGKPAAHWMDELEKSDLASRRNAAYALFKLGPAAGPAAQLLAQALEDEDAYVRDTSYKALIGLGQHARPALKALRSALNDGRERVRQLAMWALLRIDPTTVFRDEDFDVRKAATQVVAQGRDFFNEVVFGELLARTLDEDEEVRTWAARALANAYSSPVLKRPYLIPEKARLARILCRMAAEDEDAGAREAAAYALGRLVRYPKGKDLSKNIRATLLTATRDESPRVRFTAFISLGATGMSQEAEQACLVGVGDTDPLVRRAASGQLPAVSEGGPLVISALIPLLHDEDDFGRRTAARVLGSFREKSARAVPALIACLLVEKYPGAYAQALADIGEAARPALPQLEAMFAATREPSEDVAYALLRLGSPNHNAALSRLVDVALSEVGGRAQYHLQTLGATAAPALPRLIAVLSEGESAQQARAAWTLAAMGDVARPALPALEALLKTDSGLDKDLAEAIGEALKRIRGS